MFSIIIPTARELSLVQNLVDNLHQCSDVPLDIVISSPNVNYVDGASVVKDDYAGASASIALALSRTNAESTHVAYLSDECRITSYCLTQMAAFIDSNDSPFIGEFCVGDAGCFAKDKRYARWGMASRKTINMIGFFDPCFYSYYGDVDFSLRCWKAGGKVEICHSARIYHERCEDKLEKNNVMRHETHDRLLYLKRWPEYSLTE